MNPASRVQVRAIATAETWPLRLAVLRPGRPLPAVQFPGDDLPSTKHFGAFQDGELVGITSLFRAEMPERPGVSALQLRGMATAPEVRGAGCGRALVTVSVAFARASGTQLIWCNARTSAAGFYRKLGWEIVGEEFDIPEVGPHFRMWRPIG
jgi:GNAT superfamily N-acetyltransferase